MNKKMNYENCTIVTKVYDTMLKAAVIFSSIKHRSPGKFLCPQKTFPSKNNNERLAMVTAYRWGRIVKTKHKICFYMQHIGKS
jgi:hypothetical protein